MLADGSRESFYISNNLLPSFPGILLILTNRGRPTPMVSEMSSNLPEEVDLLEGLLAAVAFTTVELECYSFDI